MTLNEIKTKVPELQNNIEKLVKDNENDTNRLSDIENDINVISIELEDAEDEKKRCQDFIDKHKGNTSPKVQSRVYDKKTKIQELDKTIKEIKEELRKKEEEKNNIQKPGTDYANRAEEIAKQKAELDKICDILVQDPTINYHMQTAVMVKFDDEIKAEQDKKENYEKMSKEICQLLQDDSKDGLKTELKEAYEKDVDWLNSYDDFNVDANVARKNARDAVDSLKSKLKDKIKDKFGIDININVNDDIKEILEKYKENKLDDLSLPSFEKEITKADALIEKLEESKKTTLERLESKKVISDVQETQEIKDNQDNINRINGELGSINTELSHMNDDLKSLNQSIDNKEKNLGEPSDDYKEFKDAEQKLKDQHIIVDDMVPDLEDSDSDLSKKYKDFENADLAVRKAFQECKVMEKEEDRKKALDNLKTAIDSYKTVSEGLASLSGFDIESWQNYLKDDLNNRAMKRETLDSAYFHTNNQNFKDMLDDKLVLNDGKAMDEYEGVETSLKNLDDAQTSILNGNNIAIEDLYKGYYEKLDDFQKASGLDKGKDDISIYDLLKSENKGLIARRPINRVKNFFKRIGQKIKPKKPFKITEENKEAIAEYKNARTENDELENEIKDRNELEDLISKRDALKSQRDAKANDKIAKENELTKAKEKQNDLAKNATKNAQSVSKIEATETDFRKVTHKDDIIEAAVKREEEKAKEDEGR